MKSNSFISTVSFAFSFCRGNHLLFICYVFILCCANHPFYFTLNYPKLLNCLFLDADIFIFYLPPSHSTLFKHLFSLFFLYLDADIFIFYPSPSHSTLFWHLFSLFSYIRMLKSSFSTHPHLIRHYSSIYFLLFSYIWMLTLSFSCYIRHISPILHSIP